MNYKINKINKIPNDVINWIMLKLFNYTSRNNREMSSTSRYQSFIEECV